MGAHDIVRLPDHDCWWTRRRECELSRRGTHILGAGLSRSALETAARHLRVRLTVTLADVPYEGSDDAFTLGSWSGNLHDRCMLQIEGYDPGLAEAIVVGAVALHAHYLGTTLAPEVVSRVTECLEAETTVRLRSIPARGVLTMRCYPVSSGWIGRLLAPRVRLT